MTHSSKTDNEDIQKYLNVTGQDEHQRAKLQPSHSQQQGSNPSVWSNLKSTFTSLSSKKSPTSSIKFPNNDNNNKMIYDNGEHSPENYHGDDDDDEYTVEEELEDDEDDEESVVEEEIIDDESMYEEQTVATGDDVSFVSDEGSMALKDEEDEDDEEDYHDDDDEEEFDDDDEEEEGSEDEEDDPYPELNTYKLRKFARENGADLTGCVTREEIIHAIQQIDNQEEEGDESEPEEEEDEGESEPEEEEANEGDGDDGDDPYADLSTYKLRRLARENGTDLSGCVTREEVINALRQNEENEDDDEEEDNDESEEEEGEEDGDTEDPYADLPTYKLRRLARENGVDISGCVTREEILDAMKNDGGEEDDEDDDASEEGEAEDDDESEQAEDSEEEGEQEAEDNDDPYADLPTYKLRRMARETGTDITGCVTREEVIDALKQNNPDNSEEEEEDESQAEEEESDNDEESEENNGQEVEEEDNDTDDPYADLSTYKLRRLAREKNIDISGCMTREEVLKALQDNDDNDVDDSESEVDSEEENSVFQREEEDDDQEEDGEQDDEEDEDDVDPFSDLSTYKLRRLARETDTDITGCKTREDVVDALKRNGVTNNGRNDENVSSEEEKSSMPKKVEDKPAPSSRAFPTVDAAGGEQLERSQSVSRLAAAFESPKPASKGSVRRNFSPHAVPIPDKEKEQEESRGDERQERRRSVSALASAFESPKPAAIKQQQPRNSVSKLAAAFESPKPSSPRKRFGSPTPGPPNERVSQVRSTYEGNNLQSPMSPSTVTPRRSSAAVFDRFAYANSTTPTRSVPSNEGPSKNQIESTTSSSAPDEDMDDADEEVLPSAPEVYAAVDKEQENAGATEDVADEVESTTSSTSPKEAMDESNDHVFESAPGVNGAVDNGEDEFQATENVDDDGSDSVTSEHTDNVEDAIYREEERESEGEEVVDQPVTLSLPVVAVEESEEEEEEVVTPAPSFRSIPVVVVEDASDDDEEEERFEEKVHDKPDSPPRSVPAAAEENDEKKEERESPAPVDQKVRLGQESLEERPVREVDNERTARQSKPPVVKKTKKQTKKKTDVKAAAAVVKGSPAEKIPLSPKTDPVESDKNKVDPTLGQAKQNQYDEKPTDVVEEKKVPFQGYSISQLKKAAREAGVDISTCFERSEIVDALMRNGVDGTSNQSADKPQKATKKSTKAESKSSSVPKSPNKSRKAQSTPPSVPKPTVTKELTETKEKGADFTGWSISRMKKIAKENNVDLSGCLEKKDIVKALQTSGVKPDSPSPDTNTSSATSPPISPQAPPKPSSGRRRSRTMPSQPSERGSTAYNFSPEPQPKKKVKKKVGNILMADDFDVWNENQLLFLAKELELNPPRGASRKQLVAKILKKANNRNPKLKAALLSITGLPSSSLGELRKAAKQRKISTIGCVEKSDIFQCIVSQRLAESR